VRRQKIARVRAGGGWLSCGWTRHIKGLCGGRVRGKKGTRATYIYGPILFFLFFFWQYKKALGKGAWIFFLDFLAKSLPTKKTRETPDTEISGGGDRHGFPLSHFSRGGGRDTSVVFLNSPYRNTQKRTKNKSTGGSADQGFSKCTGDSVGFLAGPSSQKSRSRPGPGAWGGTALAEAGCCAAHAVPARPVAAGVLSYWFKRSTSTTGTREQHTTRYRQLSSVLQQGAFTGTDLVYEGRARWTPPVA
jgi:hypothetical protein